MFNALNGLNLYLKGGFDQLKRTLIKCMAGFLYIILESLVHHKICEFIAKLMILTNNIAQMCLVDISLTPDPFLHNLPINTRSSQEPVFICNCTCV